MHVGIISNHQPKQEVHDVELEMCKSQSGFGPTDRKILLGVVRFGSILSKSGVR